ncbi:MAG TPA: aminotransferase class V-fold PLP-dependent enzyme [Ilumatobacteraceae bacterium]|nr:aminotransferase class V-fold PLP-dependent enzyme [Ilumatobacteraceae bacterium]
MNASPVHAPVARDALVGIDQAVPLLDGRLVPYVNLDNAASTPAFRSVVETIDEFLPFYSGVHRGTGYKSRVSTIAFERARELVREFLGADPERDVVVFAKNTTEAINRLARALAVEDDSVVLTTMLEHHSNDLPWRARFRTVHGAPSVPRPTTREAAPFAPSRATRSPGPTFPTGRRQAAPTSSVRSRWRPRSAPSPSSGSTASPPTRPSSGGTRSIAWAGVPGLTVHGPTETSNPVLGVIPFTIAGIDHGLIAAVLGYEHGVGVRSGCFCAHPYIAHLLQLDRAGGMAWVEQVRHGDKRGAPGMVRVSFGCYNDMRDVDVAVSGLEQVAAGELGADYRADVDGSFHPVGYVEPLLFSLDGR